MGIDPIIMMPAKGTTSSAALIKADIPAHDGKRILAQTPLPDGTGYPDRCDRLRFFEGYVLLGWWAPVFALKQDGREVRDCCTLDGCKPAECVNHRREERERLTIDQSDKGIAFARSQMHTQREPDHRTRMLPAGSLLFGIQLHTRRTERQEPSTYQHR